MTTRPLFGVLMRPFPLQLLQRPVDVHRRQAGGVAELGLRNRHLEGLAVYQADGPEAHIDLAQDVRDPGVGIAATDIDHPLPKHRRIDERVPPEHIGDARVRTKEGPNHLMRDERHLAGNDCRQAVIHDLQVQALQVGDVAGDVEGHDLASAAGKELVAAGEPFEDRAALRRAVLVPDNIRVCFKVPYSDWQGGYGRPFII